MDIYSGDWILAYKEGIVVGARQWNGNPIDIPVMGYDGYPETAGYCKQDDRPEFKLFKPISGELIDLEGEFQSWSDKLISYVGTVENRSIHPDSFQLSEPYPNPFNPVTTIKYDMPTDSEIEIIIYDLKGRMVDILVSGLKEAGSHEISWNAEIMASGVYFVRLKTPTHVMTQ
jgi:hypothetical protein